MGWRSGCSVRYVRPSVSPEYRGSVGKGIGVGLLLTVGGLIAGAVLMVVAIGFVVVCGVGLAQAAWIWPAYASYKRRGEPETAKGLLILAGIVFLLNATCWGVVLGNLGNMH